MFKVILFVALRSFCEMATKTVTAGNVHDSVERDTLLLGDETA